MDAQLQGGPSASHWGPTRGPPSQPASRQRPTTTPPTFLGRFHLCILNRSVNSHHSGH